MMLAFGRTYYFQSVRQNPARRRARPTTMFLARRTMRLGWPLAMADTVAAVRAMRKRLPMMPVRANAVTVSGRYF